MPPPAEELANAKLKLTQEFSIANPDAETIRKFAEREAKQQQELRRAQADLERAQGGGGGGGGQQQTQTAWLERLTAVQEQGAKAQANKERKEGKRVGATSTTTATEEDNAAISSGTDVDIPRFFHDRVEKMQPLPVFYLSSASLLKLKNESDALFKKIKATERPLDLWDDLQFAADFSGYLPSLLKFVGVVRDLHSEKPEEWTQQALDMIAGHVDVVMQRFAAAETDNGKMEVLLYDLLRRELLYKQAAAGKAVNISRFYQQTLDEAIRLRRDMADSYHDKTRPNIYHHLPLSSTSHPLYGTEQKSSPKRSKKEDSGSSKDNRFVPYQPQPFPAGGGGGVVYTCYRCGEKGHRAEQCPKHDIKISEGTITVRIRFPLPLVLHEIQKSTHDPPTTISNYLSEDERRVEGGMSSPSRSPSPTSRILTCMSNSNRSTATGSASTTRAEPARTPATASAANTPAPSQAAGATSTAPAATLKRVAVAEPDSSPTPSKRPYLPPKPVFDSLLPSTSTSGPRLPLRFPLPHKPVSFSSSLASSSSSSSVSPSSTTSQVGTPNAKSSFPLPSKPNFPSSNSSSSGYRSLPPPHTNLETNTNSDKHEQQVEPGLKAPRSSFLIRTSPSSSSNFLLPSSSSSSSTSSNTPNPDHEPSGPSPEGFEKLISQLSPSLREAYSFVPDGLRHGFRLGIDPKKAFLEESKVLGAKKEKELIKPGHLIEQKEETRQYLYDEQMGQRARDRRSKEDVEGEIGFFQTSPFGRVARPHKKTRFVRNFSFPYPSTAKSSTYYPSINSRLSSFDPLPDTLWVPPREFAFVVLAAPEDAVALIDDGRWAYRQLKIHRDDWRWIVMEFEEGYYVDERLPMGLATATRIWGRIADLVRLGAESQLNEQFEKEGGKLHACRSWVDDFVFIASWGPLPPSRATPLLDSFWNDLHLLLSRLKRKPWSSIFDFQGLRWYIKRRLVALPEKKRLKAIQRIEDFLAKEKVNGEDVLGLSGYLSHLSFVVEQGIFHLSSLYSFSARFLDKPWLSSSLDPAQRDDLEWWRSTLLSHAPSSLDDPSSPDFLPSLNRRLSPPPLVFEVDIVGDACDNGLGLVVNNLEAFYPLKDGWKKDDDWIFVAEGIALYLSLLLFFELTDPPTCRLTAKCDNDTVVRAWSNRRSKNPRLNLILELIFVEVEKREISLEVVWIPSKENPADYVSRGCPPKEGKTRLEPRWEKVQSARMVEEVVLFDKNTTMKLA